MGFWSLVHWGLALIVATRIHAGPLTRNEVQTVITTSSRNEIFNLGNTSFLANLQHPKIDLSVSLNTALKSRSKFIPSTVIYTNESNISSQLLQSIFAKYRELDDVYNDDFQDAIFLFTSARSAHLDQSGAAFLSSLNLSHLVLSLSISRSDQRLPGSVSFIKAPTTALLPPGPYAATISSAGVSLSSVYRLYPDTYRTFLFGSYDSNDGQGTQKPLGSFVPKLWDSMIPVPSRLYSLYDNRALAGERVAIKDLFDIKGLQTSGGSLAWSAITPIANETAPSIQKILDLGGVLVGKYKLAQFASGANPWDWQDEHYPFNPRGDGWLTCSASSSGGGCSVAAYDWLDFAIGSDTGSSMRRPAAVSGTYGQRPSQGIMTLDKVLPLGGATDTAGVFSRNPYKWIKFSKAWYDPALHQDTAITGLSALAVPDSKAYPKTILYLTDYLPLNNSAAEVILQQFIHNLTAVFNMTVQKVNFTQTILNANASGTLNFDQANEATSIINTYTQWNVVGKPLVTTWRSLYSNRFPPIDTARRLDFHALEKDDLGYRDTDYAAALVKKREAVDWYEQKLQYSTPESCSESVMLYDIGPGGKPSFREKGLNDSPAASYLAVLPKGTLITGANICPIFGCVDITVPIGQVGYFSNVTFRQEMVPVTINMVVRRGCDFMLYNMVKKLADREVLKTVKTGSTAF